MELVILYLLQKVDELQTKVEYLTNASNRHEAVIGELIDDVDDINEDVLTLEMDVEEIQEDMYGCDCDEDCPEDCGCDCHCNCE